MMRLRLHVLHDGRDVQENTVSGRQDWGDDGFWVVFLGRGFGMCGVQREHGEQRPGWQALAKQGVESAGVDGKNWKQGSGTIRMGRVHCGL